MLPRNPVRMGPRSLLPWLALPVVLSACGSSARAPVAGPTVTRTVTAGRTTATGSGSGSTTSTTSTPTSASSTTASASAGAAPAGEHCVAADLALSFLGGSSATGHAELGFALRNRSTHSCRTGGYPGVLLLNAAGHALPTTPDHTTDDFFGRTTLSELTVAPGATVSFRLGVVHVPTSASSGCVTAQGLQVIAPDDTSTMHLSLPGTVSECGGALTVSPIQPGTTAYR